MPTPQQRVSLVVRALDEAEHIGTLLAAVSEQTRVPDEIVVVDSGSTDATVAIARSFGARIIEITPEEFSFGRAINRGCEVASGEILVFASAHVVPVDDEWIERLVSPFADPEVTLVYGRQTGDERSHFSELEVMRRWFPERSDPDQRHPFCNNANCAIRRSSWERRPYDESLTGLEDLEWAKRALADGEHIVYEASATIVHVHVEQFAAIVNRYEREAVAYRRITGHARLGAAEATLLFAASVVRDYMAAAARRRLVGNLVAIPKFRAGQYLGSYRGSARRGDVSRELRRRFYYPKGFTAFERRRAAPTPRREIR